MEIPVQIPRLGGTATSAKGAAFSKYAEGILKFPGAK